MSSTFFLGGIGQKSPPPHHRRALFPVTVVTPASAKHGLVSPPHRSPSAAGPRRNNSSSRLGRLTGGTKKIRCNPQKLCTTNTRCSSALKVSGHVRSRRDDLASVVGKNQWESGCFLIACISYLLARKSMKHLLYIPLRYINHRNFHQDNCRKAKNAPPRADKAV